MSESSKVHPVKSPPEDGGRKAAFNGVKKFLHRFIEGERNLQVTALLIVGLIILNTLFSFSFSVSRKPVLNRLLGQKLAGVAAPAPSTVPGSPAPAPEIDTEAVLPAAGVSLPVEWEDLGKQMVMAGVIDNAKMEALYSQRGPAPDGAGRGGMSEMMKKVLKENNNEKIAINPQTSGELLNLFWALGLANKNEILDKGEMWDKQFGGDAGKFASTGGWTLASGNVMDHYSKHSFIKLTKDQQAMVDKVSKGIFRPCCGNSTHFPDCNHGMAMLGLLQLMASRGITEADMYKYALAVNAYWFPDTYLTIASYLKTQGRDYAQTSPQELLSAQYSSAQGYKQILSQVQPVQGKSSGGCGV